MKNKFTLVIAIAFITVILGANVYALYLGISSMSQSTPVYTPAPDPYIHGVYGKGVGINPGRVVWAHDPSSVDWNGVGFWWSRENYGENTVLQMLNDSLVALTGKATPVQAWKALFEYKRSGGYKVGQKIAIKVNMNGVGDELNLSNAGFTSPVALKALLVSLVNAGVRANDITVYDATRIIPYYVRQMCSEGALGGVNFRYYDVTGANDCVADTSAPIKWSDSFVGETTYYPLCVTQATYLIDLANLKGHDLAGVSLSAKNHFGSIMNSNRSNAPHTAGLHKFVAAHDFNLQPGWIWSQRPMGTYTPLVDMLASDYLGGKTVLYMLDGLICSQTQGAQISLKSKFKSAPFNNDWTSSLLISQDPIALDSVGVDILYAEPSINEYAYVIQEGTTLENYLHEAANAPNAPSGIVYKNGKGRPVGSLGVHEHWDENKEYSRNRGEAEGIELIKLWK